MRERLMGIVTDIATLTENFLWKLEQKRRKRNPPFVYADDPLSEFDYRHFTEIIKSPSKFLKDSGRWMLEMASGGGETRITIASLQNKEADAGLWILPPAILLPPCIEPN